MPKLLIFSELKTEKGIAYSQRHLRRLETAKAFPRRVRMGNRVQWVESEIDAHIEALIEKRTA